MNNLNFLASFVDPTFAPSASPVTELRDPIPSETARSTKLLLFDISSTLGASMDPVDAGRCDLVYNDMPGGIPPMMPTGAFELTPGGVFYSGEATFFDISQGFNMPTSPPFIVSATCGTHVYWPLASETDRITEFWMEACLVQRKTLYRCTWPRCTDPELMTKTKACKHVYMHLGIKKLYECSCGVQFACLNSAKRHANTQDKTYPCQFCFKHFARKDHRGAHQRKCGSRVHLN